MGTRNPEYPTHKGIEDHPHACGDKPSIPISTSVLSGSSPRVWGQVDTGNVNKGSQRIIPTRVGTSGRKIILKVKEKDHPHACGDKSQGNRTLRRPLGSSPRVWGQADEAIEAVRDYRIIPTRVGTSVLAHFNKIFGWDHPHACGDKPVFVDAE